MEIYLHPLRKPLKAEGDISRALLILLLACLMFTRHFMFKKHQDLWSSPPSLPPSWEGDSQRPSAGDTAGCRDTPHRLVGSPPPDPAKQQLGMHSGLTA